MVNHKPQDATSQWSFTSAISLSYQQISHLRELLKSQLLNHLNEFYMSDLFKIESWIGDEVKFQVIHVKSDKYQGNGWYFDLERSETIPDFFSEHRLMWYFDTFRFKVITNELI